MPPRLGLYSLANTPEELLSRGYGLVGTEFAEDPAFGNLTYNTSYNPAPYTGAIPFQNVFRISEGVSNNFDNPSYGGSGNSRFNQFEPEGILSQASGIPLYDDMAPIIDTSYGVANEPDEEEIELQSNNKFGGIMDLLLSTAIPGYGLFKNIAQGGLEGLRGFNQRLQQSDFAQADNLMDYLDMRKYGGLQGRNDFAARNMAQARGIQNKIDTGEYRRTAVDNVIDRGRGDRPGGANYSAPSKPQRSFSSDYSEAQRARKF